MEVIFAFLEGDPRTQGMKTDTRKKSWLSLRRTVWRLRESKIQKSTVDIFSYQKKGI